MLQSWLDALASGDARAIARAMEQLIDHVGINREQGSDPARPEADLQQFNDAPAGLCFGRVFTIRPKADQQVLRVQRLL